MRRGCATRVLTTVAACGLAAAGLASATVARSSPASAPSCTRTGIASSVLAYVDAVADRRFARAKSLWLPRRRLPTPGFFWLETGGTHITARVGAGLPAAFERWVGADGELRAILLDPRPSPRKPASSGFTLEWFRTASATPLLGTAKGVFDCEKSRVAMFVGSERPVENEAAATEAVAGTCGRRGGSSFSRYGQAVRLCGPVRR